MSIEKRVEDLEALLPQLRREISEAVDLIIELEIKVRRLDVAERRRK